MGLRGRNAHLDLVSNLKNATTAFFVEPSGRFLSHKNVMSFGDLAENTGGQGDSFRELGGER